MKFLLCCLLTLNYTYGQTSELSPKDVREILSPYMTMLEVDNEKLKANKDIIDLGRILFYDKRLSANESISCNSCHDLKKYGTNGEYYTKLRKGQGFYRDVPSIYNKVNCQMFNWDGSKKTLKAQVAAAIENKHEMNFPDKVLLIERLKKVTGYKAFFQKAFPNDNAPVSFDNLVKALTLFQEGLITLAPIDRFLKGDDKALTAKQLKGAKAFDEKNCFACHTGVSFGGEMIMKLGVTREWPNQKDLGYYNVSKNPLHKMTFRVSPLRNVEKTAPYFHDASSTRLWDAIRKMGWHEIGDHISLQDVANIQDFLKSFTGEIPQDYIAEPKALK
jgi:cytochrome c peroxidase